MGQMVVAAAGAFVVALGAYRLRALTGAGAVAAAGIGFIVYGRGGPGAALPLLLFFLTASAWTKAARRRKMPPTSDRPSGADSDGDGAGRGPLQVLANGIVPAAAVLAAVWMPGPWWAPAVAGALAAVTADTWATEIGRFSRRPPVLITTGRPARRGRSGAVSLPGTVGGAVGALFLAVAAAFSFSRWPGVGLGTGGGSAAFVLAAAAGGVVGMLADSVLGATVQARYVCLPCMAETEHPIHRCGRKTVRFAGIPGFTNDTVNFITSFIGAVVAAALSAAAR